MAGEVNDDEVTKQSEIARRGKQVMIFEMP